MSTGIVTTCEMRSYSPPNTMSSTDMTMTAHIDATTYLRVASERFSMSHTERAAAAMVITMRNSVMSYSKPPAGFNSA